VVVEVSVVVTPSSTDVTVTGIGTMMVWVVDTDSVEVLGGRV